jgi:glutamine cyclotransferase
MARLVVGAIGAVVGFYIGGPVGALQGFTIAYGVSGFLDPNKKIVGPRLDDLKAPKASFGVPIPYIEGAPRLACIFIWCSDKRAIANTSSQGGKGGPGTDSTTFTYELDALGLLAINRCEAIRRIWSNGKLVWTLADDADTDSIAASMQTVAWRDIRFYDGAPDQLPDPTYEAAVGVGNAPAYRTRTTVFIEGLNLGQSGQIPILTFEVVSEADTPYTALPLTSVPDIVYAPAVGISPFSLSDVSYVFAPYDINTLSGYLNSFRVYSIDPEGGGTPQDYGVVDIGFEAHTHVTMLGNSDEPLLIVAERAPIFDGTWDAYTIDGARAIFDLTVISGVGFLTFSKVGNDIVFVPTGNTVTTAPGADGKIRRFNRTTGALLATSASALPTGVQGIAIGGAYVYALSYDGDAVYQCDLATLALVDTFAIPAIWNAGINGGHIMCDGTDLYVLGAGSAQWQPVFIQWNGATWDAVAYGQTTIPHSPDPTPGLIDIYSPPSAYGAAYVSDGVLFGRQVNVDYDVLYMGSTVAIELPTLDQVVRRLCLRTGLLTDSDIDVTDLSHDVAIADGKVRAMAVSQVSTTRNLLETLMAAYLFDAVEDEVIRFVRRGGSSVVTIPYEDMGASEDGNAEPLPLKRVNDVEIAARVSVKYANTTNDFQDGLEAADRLVTESKAEQVIEIPLGFTPSEAKKLADANTLDLAVRLIEIGPVAVTSKYAKLQPTDVTTLTNLDGSTYRARIVKATIGGGRMALELLLDDATIINSAALTDEDYTSSSLVRQVGDTDLELLDIPILRDVDNLPGFYAAFGATDPWPGAELDISNDNVTYTKLLDVSDRAIMGDATTTLGDFAGGNVFDEINSLEVDVGEGTLSSSTNDALLTTEVNALLVGAEIIQFRQATLVGPGVYTLTGLLRGRRGTEWAIPDHVADERVVLLRLSTGIRKVLENVADIDVSHYYKAVTYGRSRATAAPTQFADTGVALKPFAPVDLRFDSEAGEITWDRRSRLSGRLFGVVPLGEASESYDVELRNAGLTLVASATVSEPSYAISALVEDSAAFTGVGFEPIWGKLTIGGDDVAVADDNNGTSAGTGHRGLVRLDPTSHSVIQRTPGGALGIANAIWQFFNNGDDLYVVTDDYFPSGGFYKNSKVQKFTRTTLDTLDADNVAGTPGDYKGGAFDGTDVWVSENISGNLRRLNATTLVSIAAYAVAGGPWAMFYASGKLYVTCFFTDELIRFDTTSHTEDWRVSTVGNPSDVLVVGSLVFVTGDSIKVHDTTTGAVVESHAYTATIYMAQRAMNTFGSQVAILTSAGEILLLDSTTGTQDDLIAKPTAEVHYIAGEFSGDLGLLVASTNGGSRNTRLYTVAPPNLAGYQFTVYQNSAVVGRGYPAVLEL